MWYSRVAVSSKNKIPHQTCVTHPWRGATGKVLFSVVRDNKFQFTHPGRGATATFVDVLALPLGFNSRTPGGVRLMYSSSLIVDR